MSKGYAIVTGASRGIGAATAIALAHQGHDIVLNYASQIKAAQDVAKTIESLGRQCLLVQADMGKQADVDRLYQTSLDQLGRASVVVNSAGILETMCAMSQMDLSRWQRVFAVNVFGVFLSCQRAVKMMAKSQGGLGGSIINVSSIASRLGSPFEFIDYAASKGAVDSLTIGLAKEVADDGVRVNAIRPGLIFTDIHASGGEPGRVERLQGSIPMKRGGEANEVADAIVWLASAQASYVTGQLIDISGGR